MTQSRIPPPCWLFAAIEWAPTLGFFAVYRGWGLFPASAALIAATALSVGLSWRLGRRLPVLPLLALVLIVVLGGSAIWLHSELFLKILPTVIKGLFAAILLFGYLRKLPLLKHAIGAQMPAITAPAWRRLTLRYALCFAGLAVLNEIVWRSQPTDIWVAYKTYGDLSLLLLFIASQIPFVGRHRIVRQADTEPGA